MPFQVFNLLNARSETSSILGRLSFRNPILWVAIGAMILLQWIVVHVEPGRRLFHTVALSPEDWCLAIAVASTLLFVEELRKLGERLLTRGERTAPVHAS